MSRMEAHSRAVHATRLRRLPEQDKSLLSARIVVRRDAPPAESLNYQRGGRGPEGEHRSAECASRSEARARPVSAHLALGTGQLERPTLEQTWTFGSESIGSADADRQASAEEAGGDKVRTTGRIRVLIVDDVDQSRAGLSALLETVSDVEVVGEARDGEQAVRLVADCRPDVVVMDLRMPGVDGLEATRVIKARWPHTRVVLLTIYACRRHDAAGAGADAFVVKGAPAPELLAAMGSGAG